MTITYEFNDQREQIWLAQNDIVMHQNTDALWAARGAEPLTTISGRQSPIWKMPRSKRENTARAHASGRMSHPWAANRLRQTLNLDDRPVVLLATNVLGDSLTLGRHVFATSMAEWIEKTVQYFAARPDVQLVVRVHPGERLMKGPSIMGVIERAVPSAPEHIHVIGPLEKINTYDLMEIAEPGPGVYYNRRHGDGDARSARDRVGQHALSRTRLYARSCHLGRILRDAEQCRSATCRDIGYRRSKSRRPGTMRTVSSSNTRWTFRGA